MSGIVEDVQALKHMALMGALNGFVAVATGPLGERLGVSQQTASRRIRDLERLGYIRREMGVHRQLVRITEEGLAVLRRELAEYQRIFEMKDRVDLEGTVSSGLGEGAYYLSQPTYVRQFVEKLGFQPFPGTLNLELSAGEATKLRLMQSNQPIFIEGFTAEGRTFGGVDAWRASVGEYDCAAILPHRTHHRRVVELVAADRLRDRLALRDGQSVHVVVRL